MVDTKIRIEWSDPASAMAAYESGLRHGLVTARVDPPPRQGSTCRVELVLSFADNLSMAAESYLKQGETALFRGDTRQAYDSFRRLMELEGDAENERVGRAKIALMALRQGSSLDSFD